MGYLLLIALILFGYFWLLDKKWQWSDRQSGPSATDLYDKDFR